jgi:hypothetical protein
LQCGILTGLEGQQYACAGIFLGFTKTFKNIFEFNLATGKVKEAQHVAFDEGFFGVALVDAPPHAWLLCCAALDPASSPDFTDPFDLDVADINLGVDANPLLSIQDVHVPLKPTANHSLGLTFNQCDKLLRAHVSGIHSAADRFTICTWFILKKQVSLAHILKRLDEIF